MSEILEFLQNSRQVAAREDRTIVHFPSTPGSVGTVDEFDTSTADNDVSPLIQKLCNALNAQQISYCHWKSNWRLNRWLTGDGDLDLLIDRADAHRFTTVLHGLSFKQAEPPADRQIPGILNFYGFDRGINKFVHLHVHYQIVVGHDLTKNYHLPIESVLLENSVMTDWLPVPSPEFEFIVFVIRMVLKHSVLESVGRSVLKRQTTPATAVQRELEQLDQRADRARVANLLPQLASGIDHAFFDRCVQSLQSASILELMAVRRELERRLTTCARHPRIADATLKVVRRFTRPILGRLFDISGRKQLVNGGLLIAVVGGDGAGKTTTLAEMKKWLSKKFVTRRFHLGKPAKSLITYFLIVLLRVRRLFATNYRQVGAPNQPDFPGYVQLLRWVSAGRDRCRVYTKARRFATNGGIALCDRYPLPQVRLMEGPNIARTVKPERRNRLVKFLMNMEAAYYRKMMLPDLLIVLRVDPDVAVMRKTDERDYHVRTRSTEVWEQNWEDSNAFVIDASLPLEEVVGQAKSLIWSKL